MERSEDSFVMNEDLIREAVSLADGWRNVDKPKSKGHQWSSTMTLSVSIHNIQKKSTGEKSWAKMLGGLKCHRSQNVTI